MCHNNQNLSFPAFFQVPCTFLSCLTHTHSNRSHHWLTTDIKGQAGRDAFFHANERTIKEVPYFSNLCYVSHQGLAFQFVMCSFMHQFLPDTKDWRYLDEPGHKDDGFDEYIVQHCRCEVNKHVNGSEALNQNLIIVYRLAFCNLLYFTKCPDKCARRDWWERVHYLTNREASTVLCSVIKHAGSG